MAKMYRMKDEVLAKIIEAGDVQDALGLVSNVIAEQVKDNSIKKFAGNSVVIHDDKLFLKTDGTLNPLSVGDYILRHTKGVHESSFIKCSARDFESAYEAV